MKQHPEILAKIKKLEEENIRLRELEKVEHEFLRIASHELRTPMDVIRGNLDMVLKGDAGNVNPRAREYLEDSLVTADRLVKLISNLLDVSRIESGKLQFDIKKVDIVELIRELVVGFRVLADKKKIKLDFIPPQERFPAVLADMDRTTEVLDNLIGNALKFTPRGSIQVSVRENGKLAVVSIKDAGVGIPKAEQPKLFKKFPQIDNREVGEKGSGLGLYVSSQLVLKMGGRIWAESEGRDKGSTFNFALPLAPN